MSTPTSPRLLLAVALLSVAFVALLPSAPCRAKRRACPPPPSEAACATPVEEESPSTEPIEEEAPCAAPAEEEAPCAEPAETKAPCAVPPEEAAPCAEPAEQKAPCAVPAEEEAPCVAPAEEVSEASSETVVLTGRRSSARSAAPAARPAAERAFDPALYPWAPAGRRVAVVWDWTDAADSAAVSPADVALFFDGEIAAVETLRSDLRVGSEGEGTFVALLPEGADPAPALAAVRGALDRLAAAFPGRTLRVRWPNGVPPDSTEGR